MPTERDTLPTPGRRPTVGEVRAYYARPEILNEILQAMQRWHVRFVPGYVPQRWIYTEDPAELRALLRAPLDEMDTHPERTEYPYLRINWARYHPAPAWDADKLWGYDFVIEKDSFLWQACFEAMLPVMDILEHFGVHYWLKYTGHHSLHLVIPAACFPRTVGDGVPLTEVREVVYHRLMVFLNKRARQHDNARDRHCPPGTNMPYSVNEDTGLVNLPLLREDLATFRPWQANVCCAPVRDVWRTVPEDAEGSAAGLLAEVLRPFGEQARRYPPGVEGDRRWRLPLSSAGPTPGQPLLGPSAMSALASEAPTGPDLRGRRLAAWRRMLRAEAGDAPALIAALADDDTDVRWFAAEALARSGPLAALPALLALPYDDMAGACLVDFCVRHGAATVPALVEALRAFTAPWASLPVDEALVRIGAASVPPLRALLDDPDPDVRHRAIEILDRIAGTPTLDQILALSERHNHTHDAAKRLGWFDDPRAHRRLAELAQASHNARARREALKSLLWTDHPDAERLLRRGLHDENAKVRRWAQRGLDLLAQLARV